MALYHKYRPHQFADVVGEDHIVTTITNQVTNGTVAHAYLFSGPRGTGKTTMARLLAMAITCPKKKGSTFEPDTASADAIEIEESRSIDVIEINAASQTGVDNVRENIIENAQFHPTKLGYKVFIIDEVHMLSNAAFNALLKILEEPPAHVIFILATTELSKIPATIISRCQRFPFKKVPFDTMKAHIADIAKKEKVTIDDEVLERIVKKSDGCVRDAVGLLDQLMGAGDTKITAETASLFLPTTGNETTKRFLDALIDRRGPDAIAQIASLIEDGATPAQFLLDVIELERILLIAAVTNGNLPETADVSKEMVAELLAMSKRIPTSELILLVDLTVKRRDEISKSPLPELPLELLAIEWCSRDTSTESDKRHVPTMRESAVPTATTPAPAPVAPMTKKEEAVETKEVAPIAPEQKKTIIETVSEIIHPREPFTTVDDVRARWTEFLKKVERVSASLVFLLNTAEITKVSGNAICLSVPFLLHKERLMSREVLGGINATLEEVYGPQVHFEITVVEAPRAEEPIEDLQMLASAFGGELID